MKKITLDILWFLINKLDPLTVRGADIGKYAVTLNFQKGFLRANVWEHIAFSGYYWIKVDQDGRSARVVDIAVYKNSDVHFHYTGDQETITVNN